MSERLLTIDDILLPADDIDGPVEWQQIFGNNNSVEVEIGAGTGTFLINAARANPGINYLGIEWANKYCKYAADRARRWGLSNVRMIRCDAKDFIIRQTPTQSISTLHVYFPDPWPKKRHHKRRLFDSKFLTGAVKALVPAGQLHMATDYEEYFRIIELLLAGCDQLGVSDFVPRDTAELGEWIGTNFERKYLTQGRTIYSCTAQKDI